MKKEIIKQDRDDTLFRSNFGHKNTWNINWVDVKKTIYHGVAKNRIINK